MSKYFFHLRIPRLFKLIQVNVNISEDWLIFKNGVRRHKYKLIFLAGCYGYYRYSNRIYDALVVQKNRVLLKLQNFLAEGEEADKIFKNFLKQALVGTFRDSDIKQEGVGYLEKVIKEKPVVDQVLEVLLKSIKDEHFIDEAKVLGKEVTMSLINDKEVEKNIVDMFVRVFKEDDIKVEATNLLIHIVNQEEVKKELIRLISDSFADEKVAGALREALASSFYDILTDQETTQHFKLFMYNFLTSEQGYDINNSILDLLVQKLTKKADTKAKQSDLDSFFSSLSSKFKREDAKNLDEILKKANN